MTILHSSSQIGHLASSTRYSADACNLPNIAMQLSHSACLQGSMCSGGRHRQTRHVVVEYRFP